MLPWASQVSIEERQRWLQHLSSEREPQAAKHLDAVSLAATSVPDDSSSECDTVASTASLRAVSPKCKSTCRPAALRLRFRCTFLDIAEEAESSPRAASEPACPSEEVGEHFLVEHHSAAQLAAKLEAGVDVASWESPAPTPAEGRNREVANTLLRAKICGLSASAMPRWADEEDEEPAQAVQAASKSAASVGSYRHPELCARPCLFAMRGDCPQGAACEFCHLPHSKRSSHLDKKHREMVKQMRTTELVALALPVITEKAQQLCLAGTVFELLAALERLVEVTAAARENRSRRNLLSAMRAMQLRPLLSLLLRGGGNESDLQVESLVQQLRCLCMSS